MSADAIATEALNFFGSYSGEQNSDDAHRIVFHLVFNHSSGTVKMRYFPS